MSDFSVRFNDSGREPTQRPNPKYPNGMDIDMREHALQNVCRVELPYPAPRCGTYSVRCKTCNWTCLITVAGRVDDPKSLTVPCKRKPQ